MLRQNDHLNLSCIGYSGILFLLFDLQENLLRGGRQFCEMLIKNDPFITDLHFFYIVFYRSGGINFRSKAGLDILKVD
jgi:hypothetical protein